MSLNILHVKHETTVTAYNEGEAVRKEGGIVERTRSEEISLKIVKFHESSVERRTNNGMRYVEDRFGFQVRKSELDSKNFQLMEGRTHFIINGNEYRVMKVIDYSDYPLTKSIEGVAVRKINVV